MPFVSENRSRWDPATSLDAKRSARSDDTRRKFGTTICSNQRQDRATKKQDATLRRVVTAATSIAIIRKPSLIDRIKSVSSNADDMDISLTVPSTPRETLPDELTEEDITKMLAAADADRPMNHLPPYMLECYQKLRKSEEDEQLQHGYMRRIQKDLTEHMRLILIDWVVEVCGAYNLSSQTLQLTIGLIDRYLSKKPIERTKLQLLGITAMMLASKVEEIYPPTVGDFVYISDNTYKKRVVLEMEAEMFQTLKHKATLVTPNDMLGPFSVVMGASKKAIKLASFTIEMSMLEKFSQFALPSQIALAALFLSLRTLGHDGWKKELTKFSRYSLFDVMNLAQDMHTMLQQPRPRKKFNAVIERYQSSKQLRAALIECPPWAEIIAGCTMTTSITSG